MTFARAYTNSKTSGNPGENSSLLLDHLRLKRGELRVIFKQALNEARIISNSHLEFKVSPNFSDTTL